MRCMTLELLESILLLRTRADNRKGIEEDGMKHEEGSQNDIKRVERDLKNDIKRVERDPKKNIDRVESNFKKDVKRVERNIASVKDDMKRTNKFSDDTIIHI
jgi:hypothetical protein